MKGKGFEVRAAGGRSVEVLIYGDIGDVGGLFSEPGVTAGALAAALREAGTYSQLNVRINSAGGSATEGFAIYNLLRRQKARVDTWIDGIALSAASVIAMAGRSVAAAETSLVMIHEPYTAVIGDATELRQAADVLEKVGGQIAGTYAARPGVIQGLEEWRDAMRAETWYTAAEAVEAGLVDELTEPLAVAAYAGRIDVERRYRVPAWARERLPKRPELRPRLAHARERLAAHERTD